MPVVGGQLLAGLESSIGTELAVAATQIIEAEREGLDTHSIAGNTAPFRRNVARHFAHSPKGAAPHGRYFEHPSIPIEVKASTAAGVAPELGNMFQACGLTETVAGTVTYAFGVNPNAAAARKAVTLRWQELEDGNQYVSPGSRFNCALSHSIGERLMANFSGNGRWKLPADTSVQAIVEANVNQGAPLVNMGDSTPFTYFSNTTMVLRSWGIDFGVEVTPRPSLSSGATNGYYTYPFLALNDPTFTCQVEVEDETFLSHWTNYSTAAVGDIILVLVAGSRTMTITLADCNTAGPARETGVPNLYNLTCTAHWDETADQSPLTIVTS